jgi:hypothetical protein
VHAARPAAHSAQHARSGTVSAGLTVGERESEGERAIRRWASCGEAAVGELGTRVCPCSREGACRRMGVGGDAADMSCVCVRPSLHAKLSACAHDHAHRRDAPRDGDPEHDVAVLVDRCAVGAAVDAHRALAPEREGDGAAEELWPRPPLRRRDDLARLREVHEPGAAGRERRGRGTRARGCAWRRG